MVGEHKLVGVWTSVISAITIICGGIGCYIHVTNTLAAINQQLADDKIAYTVQLDGIKNDVARIDRNVNSINEYLRPTKRAVFDQ